MRHLCKALLIVFACSGFWTGVYAADNKENDGQDPTRPLTRFDIRSLYTSGIEIPDQSDADQLTVLGRIDKPIPLSNKWVFYWRTDVPFVLNDVPSPDNPDRNYEWGMGDWFNQFIMITPPSKSANGLYPLGIQVFGIGGQIKLDTASQQQFGAGSSRYVPLLAWKWQIGKKLQIIPVFKYEKSFGDQADSDQRDVEQFQVKPIINITLPKKWFISLYDSTDIIYENNGGEFDGEWSVPIDIMLGKRSNTCVITKMCVYSLQYIDYIIDDRPSPSWQVQARVGVFF